MRFNIGDIVETVETAEWSSWVSGTLATVTGYWDDGINEHPLVEWHRLLPDGTDQLNKYRTPLTQQDGGYKNTDFRAHTRTMVPNKYIKKITL